MEANTPTVSSLLGVSLRRSGLAPAWRRRLRARAPPSPHQTSPLFRRSSPQEETVELLPHAKEGVCGFLHLVTENMRSMMIFYSVMFRDWGLAFSLCGVPSRTVNCFTPCCCTMTKLLSLRQMICVDTAHTTLSRTGAVHGSRPPQQKYSFGNHGLNRRELVVLQLLR